MIPPQVSPTAEAASPEDPYRSRSASPESSPRRAVSPTSPSTQPPETDPLTVPSPATSTAAPGSRGADLNACTTVASPASWPARQAAISSSSTSRTDLPHLLPGAPLAAGRQLSEHLLQRRQRVPGHQCVQVRQRRHDPALHRLVAALAGVRVGPHHPVREPGQPGQLLAEQLRVATLPPVASDEIGRASCRDRADMTV